MSLEVKTLNNTGNAITECGHQNSPYNINVNAFNLFGFSLINFILFGGLHRNVSELKRKIHCFKQ